MIVHAETPRFDISRQLPLLDVYLLLARCIGLDRIEVLAT